MPIDLMGQGEALPVDFTYRGEWILKPRMFLYVPDAPLTVAPTVPRFTIGLNIGQEDWSFGFDASRMATAFEVSTDTIREANRRGELTLKNVLANTPGGDNATVKIYVFSYAGMTIKMTVEMLPQAGFA